MPVAQKHVDRSPDLAETPCEDRDLAKREHPGDIGEAQRGGGERGFDNLEPWVGEHDYGTDPEPKTLADGDIRAGDMADAAQRTRPEANPSPELFLDFEGFWIGQIPPMRCIKLHADAEFTLARVSIPL